MPYRDDIPMSILDLVIWEKQERERRERQQQRLPLELPLPYEPLRREPPKKPEQERGEVIIRMYDP